jgi:YebC/PmpR family DNA-binding regulatory protein
VRLAIEQARAVNMPKENITRIIEKAAGSGGTAITTVSYEGYGPFGVALIINATTDNIKRTVSFIKQALEYNGGAMASPGATSYLFKKRGLLTIPKIAASYDDVFTIACDAGADDVIEKDDVYEVFTAPNDLMRVKAAFDSHPLHVDVIGLVMDPMTTIALPEDKRQRIETLIETLEELDDVQTVYSNLE